MLEFLQKYQKLFFGAVTFVIVASFALFGVLDISDRGGAPKRQDKQVGTLFDGSPLMDLELKALTRFIASDAEDLMFQTQTPVNLCNNGVLRRDLLFTGIADLLVSENFALVKEDLSEKLKRAKQYRPYQNVDAPGVSARAVWSKFVPTFIEKLDSLSEQREASLDTFSDLSKLFMQQSACPPELTRRFLAFYESERGSKDPYLMHADLALFGFHSSQDWFGPNFLELMSTFILNSAKAASLKGYKVTIEEAKANLNHVFRESLKKIPEKHRGRLTLASHLRSLGFDEREAASIWQKVLLFRRYFEGASQGMLIDHLPYKDFASFSRESTSIQKYEWAPEMELKTAQDFIEFQVYLKSISGKIAGTDLPREFLPMDSIAKKSPELVQTRFRAKVSKTNLKEVGLRARVKEVLDFQLESKNWDELCSHFSFLKNSSSNEQRLGQLNQLSKENRLKVDQFVRQKWAKSNPNAVQDQLTNGRGEEMEISISSAWVSMREITNPNGLYRAFSSEAPSFEYSEGDNYFRFENVEKIENAHILTFARARNLGVLEKLSNRFLEAEYKRIREIYPTHFQAKDGEWKAFYSVKEKVAQIVFDRPSDPLEKAAYTLLEKPTKKILETLSKDPTSTAFLFHDGEDPLVEQFHMRKKTMDVAKMEEDEWMRDCFSKMRPGMFSQLLVPKNGKVSFFFYEKKNSCDQPILEQLKAGKEILGADAKRFLASQLIEKIQKESQ